MKNTIILKLFILFAFVGSLTMQAQKFIKKEEITVKYLKTLIEDAGFTVVETGSDYVKVKNTFSFKIYNDKEKGYLTFSGYYPASDKATGLKAYELCNIINQEVAFIRIDYDEESKTFGFSYYFMVEGGFGMPSLSKAINLFRDTITYSLDKDEERLIK